AAAPFEEMLENGVDSTRGQHYASADGRGRRGGRGGMGRGGRGAGRGRGRGRGKSVGGAGAVGTGSSSAGTSGNDSATVTCEICFQRIDGGKQNNPASPAGGSVSSARSSVSRKEIDVDGAVARKCGRCGCFVHVACLGEDVHRGNGGDSAMEGVESTNNGETPNADTADETPKTQQKEEEVVGEVRTPVAMGTRKGVTSRIMKPTYSRRRTSTPTPAPAQTSTTETETETDTDETESESDDPETHVWVCDECTRFPRDIDVIITWRDEEVVTVAVDVEGARMDVDGSLVGEPAVETPSTSDATAASMLSITKVPSASSVTFSNGSVPQPLPITTSAPVAAVEELTTTTPHPETTPNSASAPAVPLTPLSNQISNPPLLPTSTTPPSSLPQISTPAPIPPPTTTPKTPKKHRPGSFKLLKTRVFLTANDDDDDDAGGPSSSATRTAISTGDNNEDDDDNNFVDVPHGSSTTSTPKSHHQRTTTPKSTSSSKAGMNVGASGGMSNSVAEMEIPYGREYLVKFVGCSYRRVEWVGSGWLDRVAHKKLV
ncbi:hypothetical protein HK102_009347, partial [Quaeritorhiza haematococci]